ncbi:MAG: hypothetical protein LPJ87_08005 [Zoogloeaceae bacterium]|nr:hypothetical protein [Zoogloeaceae bacterium]
MTEKLTSYTPAAALVDEESIALFMSEALETGDAGYVAHALGVVACAYGLIETAWKSGLSR